LFYFIVFYFIANGRTALVMSRILIRRNTSLTMRRRKWVCMV